MLETLLPFSPHPAVSHHLQDKVWALPKLAPALPFSTTSRLALHASALLSHPEHTTLSKASVLLSVLFSSLATVIPCFYAIHLFILQALCWSHLISETSLLEIRWNQVDSTSTPHLNLESIYKEDQKIGLVENHRISFLTDKANIGECSPPL